MGEELLHRALASTAPVRQGLRALEDVGQGDDYRSLETAARQLRQAAGAADDAADALELWPEYARLREERAGSSLPS